MSDIFGAIRRMFTIPKRRVKRPPGEELSIHFFGDPKADPLATAVEAAFFRALALDSQLPDWVLALRGMSGRIYRRFINNLMHGLPDARYLEIGSWAGSTAAAAIHGAKGRALCIDNWSQFGGPKMEFDAVIARARGEGMDFQFVENDFRAVDYSKLGEFNVFLFDGPHEEADQYDGIMLPQPALAQTYVLIVDDWNWAGPRDGTKRALAELGSEILYSITIRTTQDASHPKVLAFEDSAWHNGYMIAVVRRAA